MHEAALRLSHLLLLPREHNIVIACLPKHSTMWDAFVINFDLTPVHDVIMRQKRKGATRNTIIRNTT